ncbi:MAG: cytochrome c biogenesis CcdA family protein [Anaerolineales bacterium]
MIELSIGMAFLAGLASFLSPCVLPLVPAYIGYLSGRSVKSEGVDRMSRWGTFLHGLAFVIGFSTIFVMFGVAASSLGGFLYSFRSVVAKIGGMIVILLGLHMTGLLHIPYLDYDLRLHSSNKRHSYLTSSLLMGIFFSAGWSPCVGPILGAILMLAINGGSIHLGIWLLSAYSAGLAIPFLVVALGLDWITAHLLRRYQSVAHTVEVMMGVLLIIVGMMLTLGAFQKLATLGAFIDFGL